MFPDAELVRDIQRQLDTTVIQQGVANITKLIQATQDPKTNGVDTAQHIAELEAEAAKGILLLGPKKLLCCPFPTDCNSCKSCKRFLKKIKLELKKILTLLCTKSLIKFG